MAWLSKTHTEMARARAAAATRAHHQTVNGRPSETFDWDRALDGFHQMIEQIFDKERA